MHKKKSLLVMGVTGNYLFSAGNVLLGIQKHCPDLFTDVLVFTDGTAPEEDKKAIQKIRPVTFIDFTFQLDNPQDRKRLAGYTNMTYSRFEALAYLDQYEKVIWLESDILITGDLTPLLDYARTGISMAMDRHPVRDFFNKPIEGYDMNAQGYIGCVIVLSDKLKEPRKMLSYLYETINRYSSDVTWAEQGIYHLMLEDFGLEVDALPPQFHVLADCDKTNVRLIHLWSNSKPWRTYTANAYDEWYDNHMAWRALGGGEVPFFAELIKRFPIAFHGPKRYQNIMQLHHISQTVAEAQNQTRQSLHQLQDELEQQKTHGPYIDAIQTFRDYYRCKLLSKITWGKKRRHYKQKSDALHELARKIRQIPQNRL